MGEFDEVENYLLRGK